MFWMATINPGRKRHARRRRHKHGCACVVCVIRRNKGAASSRGRRRGMTRGAKRILLSLRKPARRHRRLTAWQRMVRKFGGVLQAVRARRKLHKRRSAGSRRQSLRGRPRKVSTRRNVMARTKSRRRARRSRRNPLFRTASGRFTGRRTRRRARSRNPLWRKRIGQYSGRPAHRRLHRIRGGRGWHNPRRRRARRYQDNAVLPVSWNRGRRRYRRNAVLPVSWNPGGVIGGVLGRVQSFIDIEFWTKTALPTAGGFLGAKVVGGMIYGVAGPTLEGVLGSKAMPFVRAAADAVGGSIVAYGLGRMLLRNPKMEQSLWLGTVVSVAHSVLKALLGGTEIAKAIGLEGFGEDISRAMTESVARRIEQDLSGFGSFLTQPDLERQMSGYGEFVTDTALRAQPGYAPSPGGDLRDYDVARTETAL